MNKVRNSNIELLRILAMLLIIVCHYSTIGVGTITDVCAENSFNYHVLSHCPLNLGTDTFILIFGYFNIRSSFSPKKALRLEVSIWTYSMLLYAAALLLGIDFSIKELIKNTFPVIYNRWWFVSVYMIVFILSRYLNQFITMLDRKQLTRFLLTTLVIWSLIPMMFFSNVYGNEVIHFLMLYTIGAYIRLYVEPNARTRKLAGWVLGLSIALLMIGCTLAVGLLHIKSNFLRTRSSLLIIAIASSALILALCAKPSYHKWLNKIGGATFAVYLIHMHPNFRAFIWEALRVKEYAGTSLILVHLAISVILIFSVCVLIDFIKKPLIDRPLNRLVERVADKLL